MHLASLRLRDFRNYPRLDAAFTPGFHLFLGRNAQGKTNLLEAIYMLATLRSFRGVGSAQMIRHQQKGYFIGAEIVGQIPQQVKIYWSSRERTLALNGLPVRRLADYLGVFRAVVFCSEDLQLIKGPASRRRRFLDLLLSQTSPNYLPLLQRYMQAVRARNALLKQRSPDLKALDGFTHELLQLGNAVMQARLKLIPQFLPLADQAYRRITQQSETFQLDYAPSVKKDFSVELVASRSRETAMRTTVVGPHRDEVQLLLDGRLVSSYGSEGQKRSVAIALKMAQAEFLTAHHGSPPVLLIDDVMGELDLHRRSGFLPLLKRVHQAQSQVFMTATEENWPTELGLDLHRWEVAGGTLKSV